MFLLKNECSCGVVNDCLYQRELVLDAPPVRVLFDDDSGNIAQLLRVSVIYDTALIHIVLTLYTVCHTPRH